MSNGAGKKTANIAFVTILTGSGGVSFLRLLAWAGVWQDAKDAAEILALFDWSGFNWGALFVWLTIGSVVTLIFVNWQAIEEWNGNRWGKKYRHFSVPIDDVCGYVGSNTSHSDMASVARAIQEAGRSGEVASQGIPLGKNTHLLMRPSDWKKGYLDEETRLLLKKNGGEIMFSDLVFSRAEVEKFWPYRGGKHGWMG